MDLKPLIPWVVEAEWELGILFLVPDRNSAGVEALSLMSLQYYYIAIRSSVFGDT